MSLTRFGAASLLAGSLLLASCKLFTRGGAGSVALLPVPPIRLHLGQGLDEAKATKRLADAASRYVEAQEGVTGRLRLKNRRHYEIRLLLDASGTSARLGLAVVGHASFEQAVAEDLQLSSEYDRVASIARRVLALPDAP